MKAINFINICRCFFVYNGKYIKVYLIALKKMYGIHYFIKGIFPFWCMPEGIVSVDGAIQGDSHKKVMFGKESSPFFRKLIAVGLYGKVEVYLRLIVFLT